MDVFKALQDTVLVPSERRKEKILHHISSVLFLKGAQAADGGAEKWSSEKGKEGRGKAFALP